MKNKKENRGGARVGAGRKPKTLTEKRQNCTILLSSAERAILDAQRGTQSLSAFIRGKLGLK